MEYIDDAARGDGLTGMGYIGGNGDDCSGFKLPGLPINSERKPSLDQVNDLLMMMRVIRKRGPRLYPPIRKGHIIGMNKLYMVTRYQFLLFLLIQVYKGHIVPPLGIG